MKKKFSLTLALIIAALTIFTVSPATVQASTKPWYVVSVQSGYLALRNARAFSSSNEIGRIYDGQVVKFIKSYGTYWYVYAKNLGRYGYVNSNYLYDVGTVMYASVQSGYLALRHSASGGSSNIFGKIYNGQPVKILAKSGTYWLVYSSTLKRTGYVNSNYLSKKSGKYTVSVQSGYLALRNARAFSKSNEIGRLYNGDTVTLRQKYGTYWLVYSSRLGKTGYVNSNYLY